MEAFQLSIGHCSSTLTLCLLSLKALPKTVLGNVCLVDRLCGPKPDFLHVHLSKPCSQLKWLSVLSGTCLSKVESCCSDAPVWIFASARSLVSLPRYVR